MRKAPDISVQDLIENVKSEECLYDKSHPDHRNVMKKEKIWKKIALELAGVDDILSPRDVELKWKSMREKYGRELKKQLVSDNASPKSSHWKFFDEMSFLYQHMEIKGVTVDDKSQSNVTGNISEPLYASMSRSSAVYLEPAPSTSQSVDYIQEESPKRGRFEFNDSEFYRNMYLMLENLRPKKSSSEELFGQLVASSLEKLAPAQQVELKKNIMLLMYEAESENLLMK